MPPQSIGTVLQLWRFPVKSMRGETLPAMRLTPGGIEGDRRFALTSTAAPAGKPLVAGRERTATLRYAARLQPAPAVTTPEGLTLSLPSPALLANLQDAVAGPGAQLRLEDSTLPSSSARTPFFDVRPVSLISQATLDALIEERGQPVHPLRFRSNLVLALVDTQPFAEDNLIGQILQFGDTNGPQLRILERIPRCRIVSLDPETTAADPTLLRHLAQHHEGRLGVYAKVEKPGTLRVGDLIHSIKQGRRVPTQRCASPQVSRSAEWCSANLTDGERSAPPRCQ